MSAALTWEWLSRDVAAKIIATKDGAEIRRILQEVDEGRAPSERYLPDKNHTATSTFVNPQVVADSHHNIMLDLLFHCIRFGKSMQFNEEKLSSLVSVVFHTHADSMVRRCTMAESYKVLETYLVAHSVQRPPYSAAVFSIEDVKHINEYLVKTYYRHYKLYYCAFTPRTEATVVAKTVGNRCELPRRPPALSKAVPLNVWEHQQGEIQRAADQKRSAEDQEIAKSKVAQEETAKKVPELSPGLKSQLDVIKSSVVSMNAGKLDDFEKKIAALEAKLLDGKAQPGKKKK